MPAGVQTLGTGHGRALADSAARGRHPSIRAPAHDPHHHHHHQPQHQPAPPQQHSALRLREGATLQWHKYAWAWRLMADLERARRNGARSADIPGEPFDLHIRVAVACGNERARQLLTEELYHLLRLYRRRSGDLPGRREQAFDEHWQIVRAMHNRDPDLAESLMRSHIARATESLLATLAAEREAEGASAPPRPLRRRRRTRVVAASPAGAGLAAEQPHESAAFAKESERAKAR